MSDIKNILFDLGGVLINIDYFKTEKAFIDLGVPHFNEMYAQYTADPLFESLETGHTSEAEFYTYMASKASPHLLPHDIKNAWNAMLLDFRLESLAFLEPLSKKYPLYLLSNTNAIHKAAFDEIIREQTGQEGIDHYFTKAYYSHLIGYRKPRPEAFEFVLQDAGIQAEETLFIDDSANNILAAKNAGFQAHLLVPGETIEDLSYFSLISS